MESWQRTHFFDLGAGREDVFIPQEVTDRLKEYMRDNGSQIIEFPPYPMRLAEAW
jgi:hypothetical protein